MPTHTFTYFLGTTPIAVVSFEHNYNPWSRAFFCPKCGDIWARIHVANASWTVDNRYCAKHGNLPEAVWDNYSGMFRSIWAGKPYDQSPEINLIQFLPHEVLIHDFLTASEKINVTERRDSPIPTKTTADGPVVDAE